MRIIHTSDWHLGQHFYGKSRAKEHKAFLAWLIDQVDKHQVDAVIVAGDIFDTGNPPSYARELYYNFITELQQLERPCELVVLAGNHDSTTMIGESKTLLNQFSTFVIPAVTPNVNEQVFMLNRMGTGENKAVICAVPFIRPRDVITSYAGRSAKEKQQHLQQGITEHYQTLYNAADEIAGDRFPIIATGHLTTVGASTSDSVREIYIGTLDAFPASHFPKADYIALGHIHQMQTIAKSDHIRYSGSPIPLSFDEAKQDKVVLMVDVIKGASPVIEPLVIPRFQGMAMVKTSVDDVVFEIEQLIAQIAKHKVTTDNAGVATIWLDIEIETTEYRSDIQAKITEQLKPYIDKQLIEILLIRRSKSQRQQLLDKQEKITLDELKPLDVFQERLKQSGLDDENNTGNTQAHKAKLIGLFNQALAEVEEKQTAPLQNSVSLLKMQSDVEAK